MINFSSYKKITKLAIICYVMVGLALLSVGCDKQDVLKNARPITFSKPANFPTPTYDFASNPLTQEGFELGRKLFYDGLLSRDNSISCGNCHQQANAFTHHGYDVSHGIDDKVGIRNSPPIMNLAWSKSFFWDGGVFNLDLQPLGPIENPVEMDEHLPNVISKLKASPVYPSLFKKAFGTEEITSANMLKALSQFMVQCTSANSKYDKYVRKEGMQLNENEAAGLVLFQQKCSSCHSTDLFTDNLFHNNGMVPSMVNDMGRYNISLYEKEKYLFKTPSLRNVALTPPYMHDGRLYTLQAVMDHYSSGVQNSPTLDTLLQKNGVLGIALTQDEKNKLIAFLNTLTDESFIKNKTLSEQ